jgi:hypothetical protein
MSTGLAQRAKEAAPDWAKEATRPMFRGAGRTTVALRQLPDYLIIGTKRGGTTSMYKYLLRHPNVVPMWPGVENAKKTHYFDQFHDRGQRWYRSHFPSVLQRRRIERRTGAPTVTGEAAPYYMFHPLVLDRVRAELPAVKVIVLLRNPVDRIWSHHHERVLNRTEDLSFQEALEAEPSRLAGERERIMTEPGYYSPRHDFCSYLARGRYLEHLEPWLDAFPAEQIHIVRSEDLYRQPAETLTAAHRFLGIPEVPPVTKHRFNYIPASKMPLEDRARLADYYAPHVAALEARLGRSFEWNLERGGLLTDR